MVNKNKYYMAPTGWKESLLKIFAKENNKFQLLSKRYHVTLHNFSDRKYSDLETNSIDLN